MTKAKMKKKFAKLEWNVLLHNINEHKFKTYNVLREDLLDDILKLIKTPYTYYMLEKVVNSWAIYHYGHRAEYEIVISDLLGFDEAKIDAYMQIQMNLKRLTEYLIKELELEC